MTDTTTELGVDLEAAELEGLKQMPADLVPLFAEKLALDAQLEVLNGRLTEIKDTFGKRLKDEGLQGYLFNGKVKARRSPGTRTGMDTKRLKDEMPHVYKAYLKVTNYVSIRIG